jgi:Protein of unknown function (DUF3616)
MRLGLIACWAASLLAGGTSVLGQTPAGSSQIPGGLFEPSGVVAVPGTSGALIVDDGLSRELLWVTFDEKGVPGRARRIALGAGLVDQEDITTDGQFFYAVGSQSKGGGRNAAGLVRFRFNAATLAVSGVEAVSGLGALMLAQVPELGRLARGRSGPLNIEGLTWDRARSRAIFGLRTPQDQRRALLVTAVLRDPAAPLSNQNLQFDPAVIRLDLGGLAVRGLAYDAAARRVLIIGGPAGDGGGASRVFEWDGEAASAVREVRQLFGGGKPEGITRIVLGGRMRTLIVFDAGRFEIFD